MKLCRKNFDIEMAKYNRINMFCYISTRSKYKLNIDAATKSNDEMIRNGVQRK